MQVFRCSQIHATSFAGDPYYLLGRNVLITLYPRGTDRDLSFILDPEYWFRCLMLESLTVVAVDSADSRECRAPWGAVKFLKVAERRRPKAVNFEVDKLMISLPAPCAIAIAKDMAKYVFFHSHKL